MADKETDYFLGIESSTRTIALLADAEGFTVGRGTAGPSAYNLVGREQCSQNLFQAILAAFSSAGYKTRDILASEGSLPLVQAVCVGMRGVERPKDENTIRRIINDFNLGDNTRISITSEARIVLESGVPDGIGVTILSGEIGQVYGQGPDGKTARAGGWGYLLGEVGSSYQLGLAAVKAVLQAAEGSGPETTLTALIENQWKVPAGRIDVLVDKVQKPLEGLGTGGNKAQTELSTENYKENLAAIAPLVERAAKDDAVAQKLLDAYADELAAAVQAVIKRAGLANWQKPTPLVIAGSLLLSNQGELKNRLLERLPDMDEPVAVLEAAEGALKLAIND